MKRVRRCFFRLSSSSEGNRGKIIIDKAPLPLIVRMLVNPSLGIRCRVSYDIFLWKRSILFLSSTFFLINTVEATQIVNVDDISRAYF